MRLTEWNNVFEGPVLSVHISNLSTEDIIENMVKKLYEYENAEEQGLIVKLPCKVGDNVYVIYNHKIHEDIVEDFDIWSIKTGVNLRIRPRYARNYIIGVMGENVFLTEPEALQALKERERE